MVTYVKALTTALLIPHVNYVFAQSMLMDCVHFSSFHFMSKWKCSKWICAFNFRYFFFL